MQSLIILASQSPRRQELLRKIGLQFQVDPADIEEIYNYNEIPHDIVLRIAEEKARITAERHKAGIVIGADTIVVLDDDVLGKPADPKDAERMLLLLSGRMHQVFTGLAVRDAANGRMISRVTTTQVWFKHLEQSEIMSYIATGEPLDKAGAYGIQERGALFVEKIEGCFYNVVGLPISTLGDMFKQFNIYI